MNRMWRVAVLLCGGLMLASCSSLSAFVADNWPRWAGGMPADVPPRPGAPGYEEFIARQQVRTEAAQPGGAQQDTAVQVSPQAQSQPQAEPPAPGPAPNPGPPDAVASGLY
jgi:hypothetical protein